MTVEERLARLLLRELGLFYLLMPVMLASSAAALALVREKEQRTLEPILATPLRDRDLLLAKLIAAVVPALLVTWAAAVVGISAGVLGSVWRVGQIILPTTGNSGRTPAAGSRHGDGGGARRTPGVGSFHRRAGGDAVHRPGGDAALPRAGGAGRPAGDEVAGRGLQERFFSERWRCGCSAETCGDSNTGRKS